MNAWGALVLIALFAGTAAIVWTVNTKEPTPPSPYEIGYLCGRGTELDKDCVDKVLAPWMKGRLKKGQEYANRD